MITLYDYQLAAGDELKNGSILCGGVGSGKSRVSLYYYLVWECEGFMKINGFGEFSRMKKPRDLYIITTAKKRDSLEWNKELSNFCLCADEEEPQANAWGVKVVVDSWNNIKKYTKVSGAFFIFDEQRVIGSGAWVKAFLNITRKNHWILLSATPGDNWSDYIPVFVANGFYKNKTEFNARHAVFARFSKYPKIERYVDVDELVRRRDQILVPMVDERKTTREDIEVICEYDKAKYRQVMKDRWNPFEDVPIEESGKWCYLLRKVVNSDRDRIVQLSRLIGTQVIPRAIIFYNFDYELEELKTWALNNRIYYAEWNGHMHHECPKGERWVYLVQYTAGCEGWNCISTDTIIFYSQTYSYRTLEQARGRVDRINTPYDVLKYYHFRSNAPIDLAIRRALREKKTFNEKTFVRKKW